MTKTIPTGSRASTRRNLSLSSITSGASDRSAIPAM